MRECEAWTHPPGQVVILILNSEQFAKSKTVGAPYILGRVGCIRVEGWPAAFALSRVKVWPPGVPEETQAVKVA
jgi:hypothetical protein